MATCIYSLSKVQNPQGESQVYCQVNISKKLRPRFKTGVFVLPQYFVNGQIKVPRTTDPMSATIKAKHTQLLDKSTRIALVVEAFNGREDELSADFLKGVLDLCDNLNLSNSEIIYQRLIHEAKKAELRNKMQEEAKQAEANEEERKRKHDFLLLAEQYLKADDHANGVYSNDQIKSFKVVARCVWRWVEYTKMMKDPAFFFDIDNITPNDIRDFSTYVSEEHNLATRYPTLYKNMTYPPYLMGGKNPTNVEEKSSNTLIKFRIKLKGFFNWLNQRGITTNEPFKGVVVGTEKYGTPYYLSVEERNKLADFDFSSRKSWEVQRDIFVFQCHVGCRVGDLYRLTEANIEGGMLRYNPHKTKDGKGRIASVPLTETALSLISKYKGMDAQGRLFPFISEQKYNDAIKKVLKEAGIHRHVPVRNQKTGEDEMRPLYEVASSHMARRVFTASAYAQVQDPNIVGKMTGHTEGSKAFSRYNNIEDDILVSVVRSDKFQGRSTLKEQVIKKVESLNEEQLKRLEEFIDTL